jgi:hypothetical protein
MFQALAYKPQETPGSPGEPGFGDGERSTVASVPLATV